MSNLRQLLEWSGEVVTVEDVLRVLFIMAFGVFAFGLGYSAKVSDVAECQRRQGGR